MAFASADRVLETSTTTGTGTYDLAGVVAGGYQTFVAGIGTGNTCYYTAFNGTDWEVGLGTVTDAATDTLARTTILQSSNSDNAVNWGAGTKTIFCTTPALVLGMLVGNGQIQFPATQNASTGANVLDDYEEGTFTPAFSAAGATFSYSLQSGTYTKIGNLVYFRIRLALNTSGNTLTAAALSITGLPFTSKNVANTDYYFNMAWFNTTTSYVGMYANLNANATTLTVRGNTAAAVSSVTALNSDAALHATNGSVLLVNGTYIADQ